jgi:phosphate:Na+ symporter
MTLTLHLLLGLGIFLFGMHQLEQGLARLADARIKQTIARMTRRPVQSVLTGTLITALLQSSSMVSLIVLAFASAGMIPLFNAVGVILGANLGTTMTGWIVATLGFKLDLEGIALPLFGLSALIWVFVDQRPKIHASAQILMGFGLLLFGLVQMKEAVESLPELLSDELLRQLDPFLFLLLGLGMTALIRSSSAMMMIALSALDGGIIDLNSAAALVIGADIGTTSTTALGALKGTAIARQLAMSHVIYNLVVDVIAFLFMLPLLPQALTLFGVTDQLYGLVLFHSSFNFLGLFLFVPFLRQYTRWLEGFFQDRAHHATRYLHASEARVIEAANTALMKELEWLLWRALALNLRNLKIDPESLHIPPEQRALLHDCFPAELSFEQRYRENKRLEGALHQYIGRLQLQPVSDAQVKFLHHLTNCAREAVYSTKSLKDVREDLVRVRHTERQDLESGFNYAGTLGRQYELFCQLLARTHREDYIKRRLGWMRAANEQLHRRLHQTILDHSRSDSLPDDELATLLNANREIWHSGLNMIEAFAELNLTRLLSARLAPVSRDHAAPAAGNQ